MFLEDSPQETVAFCTHLWEDSLAVADQETRLSTSTVADHNKLFAVLGRRGDVCSRARGSCVDSAI